jgi:hypothetical protein
VAREVLSKIPLRRSRTPAVYLKLLLPPLLLLPPPRLVVLSITHQDLVNHAAYHNRRPCRARIHSYGTDSASVALSSGF